MPTLRVPSYRKHATGHAVVRLNGRDIYLGCHGTPESKQRYDRVIAEWMARGRRPILDAADLTIVELIDGFWNHVKTHYRRADGTPTGEHHCFRQVLRPLKLLYGESLAKDFGPLSLRALQAHMIGLKWSRKTINSHVTRIRMLFKWGASWELVPGSVLEGLRAVESLAAGRSDARESEPIRPVPQASVDAVLRFVSPQVEGMIGLQLLTAMRPGEVVSTRSCDIDTTGRIWIYKPAQHKTRHHGFERVVYLGPRAQELLKPFLKHDLIAWCFSPSEAEANRLAARNASRKTPVNEGNSPGSNRVSSPRWRPGDRYTTGSYRRAVGRACDRAFPPPPPLAQRDGETAAAWRNRLTTEQRAELLAWQKAHRWHPHQLRHSAATRVRKEFGLDAAQVVLGHKSADVAQIYAEADLAKAEKIMSDIG